MTAKGAQNYFFQLYVGSEIIFMISNLLSLSPKDFKKYLIFCFSIIFIMKNILMMKKTVLFINRLLELEEMIRKI